MEVIYTLNNRPKALQPYTLATDQFGVSYRLYGKDKIGGLLAQVKEELALRYLSGDSDTPPGNVQVSAIVRVGDKQVVGYRIGTQRFMLRHVEVQSR